MTDNYLGNYYGHHDGYDGATYDADGMRPTLRARPASQVAIIEIKPVRLGNVYDEKYTGGNFGGHVWDTDGIAPALKTGASASQQCAVEIEKVKAPTEKAQYIGCLDIPFDQDSRIYTGESIAPTLRVSGNGENTAYGGVKVIEICVSERTYPRHGEPGPRGQRLEPREDGCANTLTTVDKDNMILEAVQLQNMSTVHKEVVEPLNPMEDGTCRTLKAQCGQNSLANFVRDKGTFAATGVIECECIGGVGEKKSNGGTQYYQQDRVYTMGDVAMCHPANIPGGSYKYLEIEKEET